MKSLIIQPVGQGFSVAIQSEAEEHKAKTLALAQRIATVSDIIEQQTAIEVTSFLKSLTKGMEATREEVKKPFLQAGREIDAAAKKYAKEIDEEVNRLQSMIATYQEGERRKAEAIRREQERQQQEAEDALRRANEAIIAAKTDQARQEAELSAMELEDASNTVLAPPEPPKATGAAVREEWDFDVVNVHELYRAYPSLVKLEVNRSAVKYLLNTPGAEKNLPGIRAFKKTTVAVRAANQ